MIVSSFLAALGQLGDGRFLRVVLFGIVLSLALLAGVYAGFLTLITWVTPETIDLPLVGEVRWVGDLLGWASLLLMIGLSVFLMVPVAALFSGLLLDRVAAAVEDRHYPGLRATNPQGMGDQIIASVNFFGVLVAVNALALLLYTVAGPLVPLVFWAVNGYLLGREYFELAAARHLPRAEAKALRKRNSGRIWLAGTLMAMPLSLPFVSLLIPVLGAATFTHLFHRLR